MLRKVAQVFGVGLGVVALVFGEADDSPGLQGIGVILVMAVFFSIYKIVKKRRKASGNCPLLFRLE